jgi:hypothetical protein
MRLFASPPATATGLALLLAACTNGHVDAEVHTAKAEVLPDAVSSTGQLEQQSPVAFHPAGRGFSSPFMFDADGAAS